MRYPLSDIFNPPNLVSMLRLVMVPVLLYLAYRQMPGVFLLAVMFTVFTDVLDGFLARTLNMITELGSHLDSWGDFAVYTTLAISAWWLWPDIIRQEMISVVAIIISFTLPVLIGLIKFKTITSYHTWSVKLAVATTIICYLVTFAGFAQWPIKLAAVIATIAAIEEIIITLVMKHEHADVRSAWHAMKYYHDQ